MEPLLHFMTDYLICNRILTICDLGCGDPRWIISLLKKIGIRYIGIDQDSEIIRQNQEAFADSRFIEADFSGVGYRFPKADLYLIKDVFHFWPNPLIIRTIENLFCQTSSWVLVCHPDQQETDVRFLDLLSHTHPLDGKMVPLNAYRPRKLLGWDNQSVYSLSPRTLF